jgi:protein-tyrosine phosphatase
MTRPEPFIDIHCHLLPGLDDGPAAWNESLAMAEAAAADGIAAIVATPHQLGNYPHTTAEKIRMQTARLQQLLDQRGVALKLLPGADVRIEPDLSAKIQNGSVLTLADRSRHVLLEMPHEVYISLDRLLADLARDGLVGILSHPERNQGVLNQPEVLPRLVRQGCLLQVTAGSFLGSFGSRTQKLAESMLEQGLIHFVASDAHGLKSRRPELRPAFDRVTQLAGYEAAANTFCRNPARVVAGRPVTSAGSGRNKNYISFTANRLLKTACQFVHF